MPTREGRALLQAPVSPRTNAHEVYLAHEYRRRQLHRRLMMGVVIVILIVATANIMATRQRASPPETLESGSPFAAVVDAYRATHDFDGVVQVSINDSVVYQVASGLADEEFAVSMAQNSIFPVASNTKLFVSVALYQLQERGRVNLSQPVNAYLNQTDFINFGFANQTTWCPRVRGAAPQSPCENITFVQLLHMGSGFADSFNCDNVDPASAYCHNQAENIVYYRGALGPHVGVFINDPLVFKPGTNYSYSNPNYDLLGYMVEKLSGVRLETYLKTELIDKIGLTDTYLDPYSGGLGIRRGYVQQYGHFYTAGGERLATGTCSPYMNSGAMAGSGGLRSTVPDMQRWYLDLFAHRGTKSKVLTAESIRMILARVNPSQPMFAQGILRPPPIHGDDDWPKSLSYCGGLKCCVTCMGMAFPGNGSDSTVVISAFSNHMHYRFASRAAFEAFRPNGMYITPTDDGSVDAGGALILHGALMDAYHNTK
jgi:CubicO group peptidase (beta-lactamase class C family)